MATEAAYLRILELIRHLDVPLDGDGGIHVHYLQHGDAEEIAKTPDHAGRRQRQAPAPAAGGGKGPSGNDAVFEGTVAITAHEPTNSLVITSSLHDYAALKRVIDRLDTERRQVFIEAVVLNARREQLARPRRELLLGRAGLPQGTASLGVLGSAASAPHWRCRAASAVSRRGGLGGRRRAHSSGIAHRHPGARHRGRSRRRERALVRRGAGRTWPTPATATCSPRRTCSRSTTRKPRSTSARTCRCRATCRARLGGLGGLAGLAAGRCPGAGRVQQSCRAAAVWVVSGALGGLGGGFGGSPPRGDVGTRIRITPHINESDEIRLELEEEISDVGAAVPGNVSALPINRRTAKTQLVVRDQQTVVIGGLMRDSVHRSQKKIPLLGDIPLLGAIFRSHHHHQGQVRTCCCSSRRTSCARRRICAPSTSARCASARSSWIATSCSARMTTIRPSTTRARAAWSPRSRST